MPLVRRPARNVLGPGRPRAPHLRAGRRPPSGLSRPQCRPAPRSPGPHPSHGERRGGRIREALAGPAVVSVRSVVGDAVLARRGDGRRWQNGMAAPPRHRCVPGSRFCILLERLCASVPRVRSERYFPRHQPEAHTSACLPNFIPLAPVLIPPPWPRIWWRAPRGPPWMAGVGTGLPGRRRCRGSSPQPAPRRAARGGGLGRVDVSCGQPSDPAHRSSVFSPMHRDR